jgi:translation initiation factor IF-3
MYKSYNNGNYGYKRRDFKDFNETKTFDRNADIRLKKEDGSIEQMTYGQAETLAHDQGLDVVVVNEKAAIFKIGDSKKEEYLKKKAKKEQDKKNRENARRSEEKTITFGPNIGDNDFKTKMNKAAEFIESGHPVKVVVQFRGREISHKDSAMSTIKPMIVERMTSANAVCTKELPITDQNHARDWVFIYVKSKSQPKEGG